MSTLFKDVFILDGERERAQRGHILVSKGCVQTVADVSDASKIPMEIGRAHV
jgi:hypothetical protein